MDFLERPITLKLNHRVYFTRGAFASDNYVLGPLIEGKVLIFIDGGVAEANPRLLHEIDLFFERRSGGSRLVGRPIVLPGGEACKNNWKLVEKIWASINDAGLDRHSTVLCIGGGAFLDLVGFAAATAHRGIRLVRLPTTTLSQGDGGVGVKNGVNYFAKKNWVGTFAIPWAVVNDFALLKTLPPREKRAGLIEGIKVSLLRDGRFFEDIERRADMLAAFEPRAVEFVVRRCAELHLDHIASGGDPFEHGSARPLDFGHWVAHKMEPASGYRIGHGEAVAIGMAVDLVYAKRSGLLAATECERILRLMEKIGFGLYDEEIERTESSGARLVLRGLEEFREHLGGELTITLVTGIGSHIEVHEMNTLLVLEAMAELRERAG
ncbi:MAG: 3-dehydroquinate synthase [Verrucomicrobiales bacterium]